MRWNKSLKASNYDMRHSKLVSNNETLARVYLQGFSIKYQIITRDNLNEKSVIIELFDDFYFSSNVKLPLLVLLAFSETDCQLSPFITNLNS